MSKRNIFIFEFVSGGGFNQVDIPPSLFCEGYGMLRSIIADFKLFDFDISTLIDDRISFLSKFLNSDIINQVKSNDNYLKKFKDLVKETESCFIIAPEFSNILYNLTKIVKNYNKKLLSVDLEGIELATSKIRTYKFFRANNLNTPETFLIPDKNGQLDKNFIIQKFKKLKSPIVIKPDDGVGAESIYYLENESQIDNLFENFYDKLEPKRKFILQKYIEGKDLSISLIGQFKRKFPIILTINSQNVEIKNGFLQSEYFGGYTPVENHLEIRKSISYIFKNLDLTKFNGYYGIDFIKKKDNSIHFIEINPRLTTSYIGIRNIIDINPVELMISPNLYTLDLKINQYSIFSRLELNYTGNKSIDEIRNEIIPKLMSEIPELITPPISFYNSKNKENLHFSCFIATKSKDLNSSRMSIANIEKILEKHQFFCVRLR